MRKLAFRYRRLKEIYNNYKGNVGGELRQTDETHADHIGLFSLCVFTKCFSFRPVESHEEGPARATQVRDRERDGRLAQHGAQVSAAHPVQVRAETALSLLPVLFIDTNI